MFQVNYCWNQVLTILKVLELRESAIEVDVHIPPSYFPPI